MARGWQRSIYPEPGNLRSGSQRSHRGRAGEGSWGPGPCRQRFPALGSLPLGILALCSTRCPERSLQAGSAQVSVAKEVVATGGNVAVAALVAPWCWHGAVPMSPGPGDVGRCLQDPSPLL